MAHKEHKYNSKRWTGSKYGSSVKRLNCNVLIIGETGVGKSTFINSLANYLCFDTFDIARQCEQMVLVKSDISVKSNNSGKFEVVKMNATLKRDKDYAQDEDTTAGNSMTKVTQTYVLPIPNSNVTLRLIDTPDDNFKIGVGDKRGTEQDKKNIQTVFDSIGQLDEIHAILILMKPTHSRETLTLRFCIDELLTHLHKSAADNILFCFTNSGGSQRFTPGESIGPLRQHLDKIERENGAHIDLNQDRVFCYDNTPFRFIWEEQNAKKSSLANKYWKIIHGLNVGVGTAEMAATCWDHSQSEAKRMIQIITNIPPHETESTARLNEVRKTIITLAKPLAEISKNQAENLKLIEDKRAEIRRRQEQGEELNGKVYIEQKNTVKEMDAVNNFLEKLIITERNLQSEQTELRTACAELATFLNKNSMVAYNDSYGQFLEHQIRQEEDLKRLTGKSDILERLKINKREYEQEVLLIKQNVGGRKVPTVQEVQKIIYNLRFMENNGTMIIRFENVTRSALRTETTRADLVVPVNETREQARRAQERLDRERTKDESERLEQARKLEEERTKTSFEAKFRQQFEEQTQQIKALQAQIEQMRFNEEQLRKQNEEKSRKQEAEDRRRREEEEAQWEEIRGLQAEIEEMRLEQQQRRDEKENRRRQKQDEKRKRDEENQCRQQKEDKDRLEKEEAHSKEFQALQAQIEQILYEKEQQRKEKEIRRREKEEEKRQKVKEKEEKKRREEDDRIQKEEEDRKRRYDEERNKKDAQTQMMMKQMQDMMLQMQFGQFQQPRGGRYDDYDRHPMERRDHRQDGYFPRDRYGPDNRDYPRNNYHEQRRNIYNNRRDYEDYDDRRDRRSLMEYQNRQSGGHFDPHQEFHRHREHPDENFRQASSSDLNLSDNRVRNSDIPADAGNLDSHSGHDDDEKLLPTTCPQ